MLRNESLDEELPLDHPVRFIWALVEKLDFSKWLKLIKAVTDSPGRSATDRKLLLAIWIYATTW